MTHQEERDALTEILAAIVGPEPIPKLVEALTHSSLSNELGVESNQRLEFLGDAVLGLCVSELLAARHADANEGSLTRMRASLVNAQALARWGREVRIGECLAMGRGAGGSEREQTNVIADAVEALVAAVYEARGLDVTRRLVEAIVAAPLADAQYASPDAKSTLQERVQAAKLPAPQYRTVRTEGPQHDLVFFVEVLVGDKVMGSGSGRSKREAEQAAATAALGSNVGD